MRSFWLTFRAEVLKQRRDAMRGKAVFFSLLLWPVLTFLSAYYSMQPYRIGAGSALAKVIENGNIPLFLLSGFLVFQLFWTVVQSAWTFSWERNQGTLEIIYLTPASKYAFVCGRAVYSLFSGMWMFAVFAALTFILVADLHKVAWGYLAASVLLMVLSAILWGAFLCALCLFSRDSAYLYYIFHDPMQLFGGVRIPTGVMPVWAKGLAVLFPVTYCLFMVREALYGTITLLWWATCGGLLLFNGLLALGTIWILNKAESYVRRHGSWTLF